MEKKEYMIPTCEVVEMELVNMIAGSSIFNPGGDIDENDPDDMGTNRHRGEWGNLWNR